MWPSYVCFLVDHSFSSVNLISRQLSRNNVSLDSFELETKWVVFAAKSIRETSLFALMIRKELFCVKDCCNKALLSFDKPSILLSANQT